MQQRLNWKQLQTEGQGTVFFFNMEQQEPAGEAKMSHWTRPNSNRGRGRESVTPGGDMREKDMIGYI